ncbi:MAG: hypothetical protein ACEY3F_01720 [Wolbachia sp.]
MASIDVFHSCTNIAIWYIANDVIPVSSTGMTKRGHCRLGWKTGFQRHALEWHHFLSTENINRKIAWHFVPRLVL